MTNTYFEDMMASFGGHTVGRTAFATLGALPYSVEFSGRKEGKQQFLLRLLFSESTAPLQQALKEAEQPYLRWAAEADHAAMGEVLEITLAPPSDFYVKSGIHSLLRLIETAAEKAGLEAPHTCPLCGLARCDTRAYLSNAYRETHAACLQSRLALPEEDIVPKRKIKGYVITGILGALAGAIIGALPNFALAMNRGTISWALYVFIPFLSALVYRLCRGKANAIISGVTVLLSSLLAAFALEQVWYWLVLTSVSGHNYSFAFSIADYFATHNFTDSVREMLLSLLALLVGYFASTVILRRYAAGGTVEGHIIRGSRFVRESARPMQPALEEQADADAAQLEEPTQTQEGP